MNHKEFEEYILSKSNSWIDHSFDDDISVYKVGSLDSAKIFAVIQNNKKPVQISLRCDPILAEQLRSEYETVMPAHRLNKRHWNTIVASGQIDNDYLLSLIDLSYNLAREEA